MRRELLSILSETVRYPSPGYLGNFTACRDYLAEAAPEAASALIEFVEYAGELTDEQLEELFTQTFDHNPTHALEIGWHLFGEDYHRGALLVRLRQELRRHDIDERGELPDHLSSVLLLLARMTPSEADAFAKSCVVPAVGKLVEGLQKNESPYAGVVKCIDTVLRLSCERAFEEINDGSPIHVS